MTQEETEERSNPLLVGLSDDEVIHLRAQVRGSRSFRSEREFAVQFTPSNK